MPQSQNIDGRIEITVHLQSAMGTRMNPFAQIFFDQRPAPRAHLRGVPGIDCDYSPTGAFSLVGAHVHESIPGGIHDRTVQGTPGFGFDHILNFEVFKDQGFVGADQLPGGLVQEVVSLIADLLGNLLKDFPRLPSLRRGFLRPGNLAVCLFEPLFGFLGELRVLYFFPVGKRNEGRATEVDTNDAFPTPLTCCRFSLLDREDRVPFIHFPLYGEPLDSGRLRKLPMKDDGDIPNLGEMKNVPLQREAGLGVRERLVPTLPLEPRIAGLLSVLCPSEERSKGKIDALMNICEYLRMRLFEFRLFPFPFGKKPHRVVTGEGFLLLFPRLLAKGKRLVVRPTTKLKSAGHEPVLGRRGLEPEVVVPF